MLQQEQQNAQQLEQIAQRERQAVQVIQNALQTHQVALQRMQECAQLCSQLEMAVQEATNVAFQSQTGNHLQSFNRSLYQ
ncbi:MULTISPECIES: hypothetical protein [Paenibacillus]|jgi:hypothetical protein|uniref:hypothetical protein n=1 Tax=Paenibacillus TaxID=44249 RepID=UPI0030845C81